MNDEPITPSRFIGLENVLSLILVNESIRPAFLLQTFFSEGQTENKLFIEEMKKLFPNLVYSDNYTEYKGTIISKKNYNGQKNITNEKMGEILGYPCYKDITEEDGLKYTIDVMVTTNEGHKISIFTNSCISKSKLKEFTRFAKNAKRAFSKKIYKSIIDYEIVNVEVVVNEEITIEDIINKLIKNNMLSNEEKDKVLNGLFNYGFSMKFQDYFMAEFQYNNPIHKGILLQILLNCTNNAITAFYPLQKYPEESIKVNEFTQKLENELMVVLKKTAKKTDRKTKRRNYK